MGQLTLAHVTWCSHLGSLGLLGEFSYSAFVLFDDELDN